VRTGKVLAVSTAFASRAGGGARSQAIPAAVITFIVCVLISLTFTQMWVMPLTGPDGDPDASGVIRSLYFPAYGATLVLMGLNHRTMCEAAIRTPLLWMLMVLIFVSGAWSTDAGTTERRAVAVLFTTFAGVLIGARFGWLGICRVFAAASGMTAVASLLLAVLLPSYGIMHTLFPGAWRGVWNEKNLLGDHMAQAVIFAAAAAVLDRRWRAVWLATGGLCLALVLLSTSKTSLVTLVMGLAALAFVWLVKRGPLMAIFTSWVAAVGLALAVLVAVFASDAVFALLGKDATLTGRTQIWSAVMRQLQTRPWTGFGYAAVWDDKSVWAPMAWITKDAGFVAHHAHNSWLEAWLGLGLVGLVLWSAIFAVTWGRTLFATYGHRGGYLALPFMVVFSLTTLTESVAFVYNDYVWVVFTAIAVRLSLGEDQPAAAVP